MCQLVVARCKMLVVNKQMNKKNEHGKVQYNWDRSLIANLSLDFYRKHDSYLKYLMLRQFQMNTASGCTGIRKQSDIGLVRLLVSNINVLHVRWSGEVHSQLRICEFFRHSKLGKWRWRWCTATFAFDSFACSTSGYYLPNFLSFFNYPVLGSYFNQSLIYPVMHDDSAMTLSNDQLCDMMTPR